VLPSNTLNVLHGLTEEVKSSGVFGALSIEIVTFEETAEKLPVKKNGDRAEVETTSCERQVG
jgi:hypothetical protein